MIVAGSAGWLTPTRAVGMASFGCAAVASGLAWNRMSGRLVFRFSKVAFLPMILTLIQSILFLDIVFDLRWRLHDLLLRTAVDERVYAERRLPQALVLLVLALVVGVVCYSFIKNYWRNKGAMLALLGTGIGVASWCMEVISLHQVDAVLYGTKGPFMAVVLIWILVGLMTAVGITVYARSYGLAAH